MKPLIPTNKTFITLLSASMALAYACAGFSQEKVDAPQSLEGAAVRLMTAGGKEIHCHAEDVCIVLYKPLGHTAQLILTHTAGEPPQQLRHEKLSGDESYDAKENKGTPALLAFNAVKGSVYHVSVEGYWTIRHSQEADPVQSMEIIFPTNVSIHGECIELLPNAEEFEEPQQS